MEKRNTAVDLTDLAIGILILGIVVTVGAVIMLKYQSAQISEIDTITTHSNITAVPAADVTLGHTGIKTVGTVLNSSNLSEVVPANNYSIATSAIGTNGTINVSVNSEYNVSALTVNYDIYDVNDARYALPGDAAAGLAEYGNWFDIIVIVGIAGLILALIFMAFGNRSEDSGGIGY